MVQFCIYNDLASRFQVSVNIAAALNCIGEVAIEIPAVANVAAVVNNTVPVHDQVIQANNDKLPASVIGFPPSA